jgi:hypothetical protein
MVLNGNVTLWCRLYKTEALVTTVAFSACIFKHVYYFGYWLSLIIYNRKLGQLFFPSSGPERTMFGNAGFADGGHCPNV